MTNILNTKALLSVGVILAMAAAAMGATYAAWTDEADVTGNTVGAATIALALVNDETYAGADMKKPLVASNLLPGQDTDSASIRVRNDSSVPVSTWMKIKNVGGDADFCAALDLTVQLGGSLTPSVDSPKAITDGATFFLGNMPANIDANNPFRTVTQFATLDENADNSLQGKTCTWDEEFSISSDYNPLDPFSF